MIATLALLAVLGTPLSKPVDLLHQVSGSGKILVAPNDEVTFQFDASESRGTVTGEARFSSASGFGFTMYVDCLSVVGHTAWLSGALTSGTYPLFPGQSAVFQITDGPDQISRPITGIPSPCTDRSERALYPVNGNIEVR